MITERLKRLPQNLLIYGIRREAMIKSGYSESYAECGDILHTIGYKQIMEPVAKQLEAERQRIIDELRVKDLSQEKHKDLVDSMDKITKNIQLLTGGATDINKVVFIPSEIADKNNIQTVNEKEN